MRTQIRTCKLLNARENVGIQVKIGFSRASDWLGGWREFSRPITERSNAKPKHPEFTFDTHFKIVLFVRHQSEEPQSFLRWIVIFVLGVYCQAVWLHASPEWLWHSGRRHHNWSGPQQQKAVGKTHHSHRNRNVCQFSSKEERMQASRKVSKE